MNTFMKARHLSYHSSICQSCVVVPCIVAILPQVARVPMQLKSEQHKYAIVKMLHESDGP